MSNCGSRVKTQVLTFRLPVEDCNKFEIKCIEQNQTMSDVLRASVKHFMFNLELQPKDKINLHDRGLT